MNGSQDQNAAATGRQQQWQVEGFDGYFSTKTGGEVSAETTQAWDGGVIDPEVLGGTPTTSNITLTRPYRSGKHRAMLKELARQVGSWRTTVSGYDTDPDLGPWGDPLTYADALLVRMKWPEYDRGGSDPQVLELEFAVRSGV